MTDPRQRVGFAAGVKDNQGDDNFIQVQLMNEADAKRSACFE